MIHCALKQPYVVVVGVLISMVLGVVVYQKLPTDLLPTFNTPAVQLVPFYPGMPPVVMERDIAARLERWTGQSGFCRARRNNELLAQHDILRDQLPLGPCGVRQGQQGRALQRACEVLNPSADGFKLAEDGAGDRDRPLYDTPGSQAPPWTHCTRRPVLQ